MLRQEVGRALRAVERFLRPVDLEHAARGAVIVDAGLGADLLQRPQRMQRQMRLAFAFARNRSGVQLRANSMPQRHHVRYGAVAQKQRRIFLSEPLDDLRRHAGLRPGLDLAGMDDAAISPARFHAGFGLALDKHDIVACLA